MRWPKLAPGCCSAAIRAWVSKVSVFFGCSIASMQPGKLPAPKLRTHPNLSFQFGITRGRMWNLSDCPWKRSRGRVGRGGVFGDPQAAHVAPGRPRAAGLSRRLRAPPRAGARSVRRSATPPGTAHAAGMPRRGGAPIGSAPARHGPRSLKRPVAESCPSYRDRRGPRCARLSGRPLNRPQPVRSRARPARRAGRGPPSPARERCPVCD